MRTAQERRILELEDKIDRLKSEVKMLESLVDFGEIYVKTSARDCDGVSSYSNYTFTSVIEHYDAYDSWADSLEGPASWEVVDKRDLHAEEDCGTFGQGWGIN